MSCIVRVQIPLSKMLKTPLESEPLRFGQQWRFCCKPSIYAGCGVSIFKFKPDRKIKKCKIEVENENALQSAPPCPNINTSYPPLNYKKNRIYFLNCLANRESSTLSCKNGKTSFSYPTDKKKRQFSTESCRFFLVLFSFYFYPFTFL